MNLQVLGVGSPKTASLLMNVSIFPNQKAQKKTKHPKKKKIPINLFRKLQNLEKDRNVLIKEEKV